MLRPKILSAIAFAAACAFAASAGARHDTRRSAPPAAVVDEFRYVGRSLVCVSELDAKSSAAPTSPCLHIGAVGLDETPAAVERSLGRPWRIVAVEDGATMNLYPLHGDVDASPYLAVRFRDGLVDAIQLSGAETPDPYSFSGLRLGDPARQAKETLGPVTGSENLAGTDVTLLSYLPVPISIEVRHRKIVSIKIWHGRS